MPTRSSRGTRQSIPGRTRCRVTRPVFMRPPGPFRSTDRYDAGPHADALWKGGPRPEHETAGNLHGRPVYQYSVRDHQTPDPTGYAGVARRCGKYDRPQGEPRHQVWCGTGMRPDSIGILPWTGTRSEQAGTMSARRGRLGGLLEKDGRKKIRNSPGVHAAPSTPLSGIYS